MPAGSFFADSRADAFMGSLLALTGELLFLSARQRRLEAAIGSAGADLDAPLRPDERAWLATRADVLVAAWLDPFRTNERDDRAAGASDAA
jgi:hypothetical protein